MANWLPFAVTPQPQCEAVPWIQRFTLPRVGSYYENYLLIHNGTLNPLAPPMFIAQCVYHIGTDEQWEHLNQITCGQLSRAVSDYDLLLYDPGETYNSLQHSTFAYEDILGICITLAGKFLPILRTLTYPDFPRSVHNNQMTRQVSTTMRQRTYSPVNDHRFLDLSDYDINHETNPTAMTLRVAPQQPWV